MTLTSGTPCEAVSVEIWCAAVSGHNLGAQMLGLDVIFFKLRVYVLIRVQMAIAANCGMLSQIWGQLANKMEGFSKVNLC